MTPIESKEAAFAPTTPIESKEGDQAPSKVLYILIYTPTTISGPQKGPAEFESMGAVRWAKQGVGDGTNGAGLFGADLKNRRGSRLRGQNARARARGQLGGQRPFLLSRQ